MAGLYAHGQLARLNADAGADLGYEQADRAYSSMFSDSTRPGGDGFEKGSTGRRAVIIWGASAVWLFLVWRAVRGF